MDRQVLSGRRALHTPDGNAWALAGSCRVALQAGALVSRALQWRPLWDLEGVFSGVSRWRPRRRAAGSLAM